MNTFQSCRRGGLCASTGFEFIEMPWKPCRWCDDKVTPRRAIIAPILPLFSKAGTRHRVTSICHGAVVEDSAALGGDTHDRSSRQRAGSINDRVCRSGCSRERGKRMKQRLSRERAPSFTILGQARIHSGPCQWRRPLDSK